MLRMGKLTPKVSVIIPTYNVEQYIEKCLNSVISQTLVDVEIIIVDDGSTDSTPQIIKEYEKRDSRIKVYINDTNHGAGYTKNRALAAARGEYVGFVDSDDYVDVDYFETLYCAAQKHHVDIACTNIALEYPQKTLYTNILGDYNCYLQVSKVAIEIPTKPVVIKNEIVSAHWGAASVGSKVIRRSYLLQFPFFEGACDDLPAILPAIAHAPKIVYVPNLYYHYTQREGSLENSGFNEKRLSVADSIVISAERILSGGEDKSVFVELLYYNSMFNTFLAILSERDSQRRLIFLQEFRNRISLPSLFKYMDLESNIYFQTMLKNLNTGEILYYKTLIDLFVKGEIKLANEYIEKWEKNKSSFRPKISIVIPVYNGANYMRDAIGSALAQTYPNIEVIVINDGSDDNGETERIALSYGERIKYYAKENGGVATALNLGIEKMTGEYFSWLSHDDMYTYDKLEKQVKFLSELEDKTTILAGGYMVVDQNNKYLYDVDPLKLYPEDKLEKSVFSLMRGCINGCALLIHKSHFERVGMFNPALPTTQDYELFFRMFRGQTIKFHSGLYVRSRSHEKQGSKKHITPHIIECNQLWISMMEALSDDEKRELDGSTYLFYRNTRDFMISSTSYDKAIAHASKRALEEARKSLVINQRGRLMGGSLKLLMAETGLDKSILDTQEISDAIRSPKGRRRIAFLLGDRNALGGLNRVVLQIAGLLCNTYDVYIISFDKSSKSGYTADSRIKEIVFPMENEYFVKLPKLLMLINIDLLIASYNCFGGYLNIYSRMKEYEIKTIAWNHEFFFVPYGNQDLYECLSTRSKALAKADVSLWLNSFSANIYALMYPNGAVIPNPMTIELPEPDDICKHPKNIVAVGRFDDPRKGLAELLRTFAVALKRCPKTELSIVGPYDLKSRVPEDNSGDTYEMLIHKLGLTEKQLHFTGWVKDVETYYRKACVNVMPSRHEGFGLVITEAAAYGLPSVIFEGSGLDDIITDGQDGFIVPQGDVNKMAEKIICLLTDEKCLQQMSEASRQMVKRYSLPKIEEKWRALVQAVLTLNGDELNTFLQKNFMFPVKDEKAFIKQTVNEYERCVISLCEKSTFISNAVSFADQTVNPYMVEVQAMQNSFSWRITKPLRWTKKIFVSLKKYGIRITWGKILKKIKMKLNR